MGAAGGDFQIAVSYVSERIRARRSAPINQMLANPLIGGPELHSGDILERDLQPAAAKCACPDRSAA